MRVTYDKEADAAYIYFKEISKGEIKNTISLNDSVNIDLNEEGKSIGIEILNASKIYQNQQLNLQLKYDLIFKNYIL